jgi:signal transduction histidine kinase
MTAKEFQLTFNNVCFDPFYSTKANGTGLGLSIAARIAEQHGGVLQYQTQLNRGTTFGIILPAKSEA